MRSKSFFVVLLSLMTMMMFSCKKEIIEPPKIEFNPSEGIEIPADGGKTVVKVLATRDWKAEFEDEYEGVSILPQSGKASQETEVTIEAGVNEGFARKIQVRFTAGTLSRVLVVNQDGLKKEEPVTVQSIRDLAADLDPSLSPDDEGYKSVKIDAGVKLKAFVVTNRDLNNMTSKKNVYIQDDAAGLQIRFNEDAEFAFADELELDLSGATLGYYYGSLQLSGISTSAASTLSSGNTIEAKKVTVQDFIDNKYDGQYIELPDVQVKESDLEKTFVVGDKHTSINVEDKTGYSFVIFSSKYSSFKDEKVPQGAGPLKGISMINNGTMQMAFASTADYSGMTGERFGSAPFVNIDINEYKASAEGGSFEINVTSNSDWTVTSSDSWLKPDPTSGNGNAKVTVTFDAGKDRSATLTFQAGVSEAVCTVTQRETKNMTIPEVIAAQEGEMVSVEALVYGTYSRGYMIGDGANYLLVYESDKCSASVGDIVKVSGEKAVFNGLSQIIDPVTEVLSSDNLVDMPDVTNLDGAASDALVGATEVQYISYKGKLTISGNYYNVSIDGASKAIGSISYPDASLGLSSLSGHDVQVTGFYVGTSAGKYLNTMAIQVDDLGGGTEPDPELQEVTIQEFLNAPVSKDKYYKLTGKITNISNTTYGNLTIEDATASVYVYGLTATKQSYNDKSFSSLGLKVGDEITIAGTRDEFNEEPQVGGPAYCLSHQAPEPEDEFLGDAKIVRGENAYYEKATINGTADIPVLKLGTSSKFGTATFVVPAGKHKVTLYAVSWKDKSSTLTLECDCGITPASVNPASNDGASNNQPYTITVSDSDQYTFDVALTDADRTVTLTHSGNRVILWDIRFE